MSLSDLSVLVSGPLKTRLGLEEAATFLGRLRQAFPTSEIIISTWVGEVEDLDTASFTVLENRDPGPDLDWAKHPTASNYSRMVHSAAEGLRAVGTPWVIKTRCEVNFDADAEKTISARLAARWMRGLLVSRWWTLRTSDAIPFHLSDILHIGSIEDVGSVWFGAESMRVGALRNRSRSNPSANEQMLWSSFAASEGLLPETLRSRNDSSPTIQAAWRRVFRDHAQVFVPETLGIESRWSTIEARLAPQDYLRGKRAAVDTCVDSALPLARRLKHRIVQLSTWRRRDEDKAER